ncbi:MAG: major capsid protein [Verrucomicrobia bacterium]|nr:major capsid protein [Verrucomicrobiota bacterium]
MKSSVTHNPALSSTLNKYYVDSAGFVGLTLAPLFRSGEQAAFYYVFDRENFLNIPRLAARAPGTPYVRSSMKLSDATFACKNYGSEIPVADEERKKYAVAFDADQAAIRRNGLIILFNHEVRVKAIYDAAGVPHANAPVKWDDFANAASDPVGDVKAAKRVIQVNSGLMPNVLAMSQTVYDKLTEHPKIKGLYPFADGPLTRDQVRKAFEVDQLIIAGAVENTAAEGQVLNPAYLWGDSVVLAVCNPAQDLQAPTAARTFLWNQIAGGAEVGSAVETYRDTSVDADIHRIKHFTDERVIGAELAYRFDDVLT